jgi:predicted ribosome-associated RNA-binding protein Tma20
MSKGFEKGAVLEIRLRDAAVPFAIGVALMSSDEITPETKGTAIAIVHVLQDGLEGRNRLTWIFVGLFEKWTYEVTR